MSAKTGISWTDATWNPIRGCSRVSAGCVNCYAEKMAGRFSGPGQAYEGLVKQVGGEARWTGQVAFIHEHLADPIAWRTPKRIFVNSMSDLFHEELTDHEIFLVFQVMARAPRHTFQVLTKRPERMRTLVPQIRERLVDRLEHVHLGVSVENQATANERIPLLLRTPAAVRWISAEPLLGPIDLGAIQDGPDEFDALYCEENEEDCDLEIGNVTLDWVVVGGESGLGHRPMDLAWLTSIVEQCRTVSVPVWVKQDSGPRSGLQGRIPDELMIREFPR